MRLYHEPKQVSHRLEDLLQFKVHLWNMAVFSDVSLETEDQVLVGQHRRKVLGDVDVKDCVEVLVFVVLELAEDGDLGEGGRGVPYG